ncbi:hypothetical protein TWF173_002123 [Orbilia oligospora]|nr:hypothetical protein TWF173_002123 [Orbilia oligospora]
MPTLKNVTCNIHIDGKRAENFSPFVEGHIYRSFIVAEDRKPYTFHIQFGNTGGLSHCIWIKVDGQIINGLTCGDDEVELAGSKYGLTLSYGKKMWEYRHLEFRDLDEIGDPNDPEDRPHRLKNVGRICIIIRRQHGHLKVINADPEGSPENFDMFVPLKSIPESERKKRNITHGTEVSQEVADFYDATRICVPNQLEEHNHVIFVFEYASRAMLRKMGVLPPDQMCIDDDLVGMTMDNLQQEVMSLRNKNNCDQQKKSKFGWRWPWRKAKQPKAEEAPASEKTKWDSLDQKSSFTTERLVELPEEKKPSKIRKAFCF